MLQRDPGCQVSCHCSFVAMTGRSTDGRLINRHSPPPPSSFRLFDEQKDVLILVFLEDIPTRQLSPFYRMRKMLKRKTYLSWPRAERHPRVFWEKLRQALLDKDTGCQP